MSSISTDAVVASASSKTIKEHRDLLESGPIRKHS